MQLTTTPRQPPNRLKLNTPALRKEAFESYCAHISSGQGKTSWVFSNESIKNVTHHSMEHVLKEFEEEFDIDDLRAAYARNFAFWEQICMGTITGQIKNCNSAILMMIMRNRFGYDRIDFKGEVGDEVESSYRKLMQQIQRRQMSASSIDDAEIA